MSLQIWPLLRAAGKFSSVNNVYGGGAKSGGHGVAHMVRYVLINEWNTLNNVPEKGFSAIKGTSVLSHIRSLRASVMRANLG